MSYDAEKVKLGRKPFIKCTLRMDYCSLTHGVPPCTATQTGDQKCFNTRATCNDTVNYAKTTKDYKFCQPRSILPPGENMFPVIKGAVEKSPTSITAGKGLGKRAVIKININDFPHHDRDIDPYVDDRTYTPEEQGTFWGKFLTRNPYYEGRSIIIDYGYIGDPYSETDFESQTFDIVDMSGVNNGVMTITAKDVLVRTYSNKAQYPAVSTGKLLADITAGGSSATLTPTGIGDSEYPASGTLVIGKEVMTFTRLSDVLTLTGRNQWGTTASAHQADDAIQICATWDSVNIIDVLDELLTTGAGFPSSYIPTAEWEAERDLWMTSANVKGILIKPEAIEKVLHELTECFMFDMWWDGIASEVKIKALSPEPPGESPATMTEGSNIIQNSIKIERKSKDRFTQIRVFYNKADYSEKNETEQFKSVYISADASRASSDRYDGDSIKTIMCRWFDLSANAAQLAGRLLVRFSDTPETITFKLDQKDDGNVVMAERVEIDSWQLQDATGANDLRKYQITEINEGRDPGHDFTVKAFSSSFFGRYGFITIDSMVDYSSATEAQKESNGFICLDTGLFADSSEGYKII